MNGTTINTSRRGRNTVIVTPAERRARMQAAAGVLRSFSDKAAPAAPEPGFETMEPPGIAGEQDA